MEYIGITEGADPTVNKKWIPWVQSGEPAILITKMPRLLLQDLKGDENIVIHCTITGLGGTNIEPNIDNFETSLEAYETLVSKFKEERLVLRVDPIFTKLDFQLKKLDYIVNHSRGRVRISFLDLYPHVVSRLLEAGVNLTWQSFHAPLEQRKAIWEELGKPEVCAEPGLPSTPCVSELDCEILGVKPSKTRKGQRELCNCLANKIELCKSPPKCTYGCLYCYWK